jgi:mannose-6-phosphate isomerase
MPCIIFTSKYEKKRMDTKDAVFLLEGKVQHYAWGGYDFIPTLLNKENLTQLPFAEYWLGAHPGNSSDVIVDEHMIVPLNAFIDHDPAFRLGTKTFEVYPNLPFLFKVLDVREMLSIQVHPDKENAIREFEKENAAGIPVHDAGRNYKDDNHKLELAVALDELWLLHGFKPAEKLIETLRAVPEFNSFIHIFQVAGYQGLYSHVMELAQPSVNAILNSLVERVVPQYESGSLNKSQEDYWAAKAAMMYTVDGNFDRGIFSIYFLNLFKLNKGEGIYQGAGILHAYLEGRIVELMSSSDNVLRGGLTVKHIDIAGLMKLVDFNETKPEILAPKKKDVHISFYETPAPDFLLKKYSIEIAQALHVETASAEIIFVLSGEIEIQQDNKAIRFFKGQSALILANQTIKIKAKADSVVFAATVNSN